jgi:polar amino acid transport system substrate-binding protein
MKKYGKIMLVVLLALGLVLSAAACGKPAPAPQPPKQEPPKEQPKPEVVYKVGTEPTFPPFEFLDKNTNEITGFDIDLIKAIAAEEGFKVEVVNLGFDGLIPALQSGTIDIIASGMTITDKRKEQIDFSNPYVNSGLAIAVAKNNDTIKSEADLKGKKVAVQIGTTGANKADELKKKGIIKTIKTYNTVDVVMAEVAKGTVDAAINDAPVTQDFISKGHSEIKIVGDLLDSEQYGFAVAKGKKELLDKINSGLKKVIEKGQYKELLKKYNLPETALPK